MRTMYDSTTAADIPADAQMVAGYVDGRYAWSSADWARFPNAVRVRIVVSAGSNDGQVLDVEQGDATPDELPAWLTMRRAAGVDPSAYVNRSNWQASRDACARAGVAEPHWWLAAYDGVAEIPAGTVAKQYADEAMTTSPHGHFDLSAVADFWPGVDTMDAATYARELEDLVKGTIRVMVEQDGQTKAAVEAIARDVIAKLGSAGVQLDDAALARIVRAIGSRLAA